MKRMKEDVTVFHLKPVAAAVMIAASGSALAQSDSATDEARVLDEIVVTATRREQSVQEIPYSRKRCSTRSANGPVPRMRTPKAR